MKKHAILLAALIGAASAQAQVYGTVAVGGSHLNIDCTGTTSCKSDNTGVKVVGGYAFGNGFSVVLGLGARQVAGAAGASAHFLDQSGVVHRASVETTRAARGGP